MLTRLKTLTAEMFVALALACATAWAQGPAPPLPTTGGATMQAPFRFNAAIVSVGLETVVLKVDGQTVRMPLSVARLSSGGVDLDPATLSPGQLVTVSVGSLRGSVTDVHGTVLTLRGPSGIVELPTRAIASQSLASATVSFREQTGRVTLQPVSTAMDYERRGLGRMAPGVEPTSGTDVATATAPLPGATVVVVPPETPVIELGRLPAGVTVPEQTTTFVSRVRYATASRGEPAVTLVGRVWSVMPSHIFLDTTAGRIAVPAAAHPVLRRTGPVVQWRSVRAGDTLRVTLGPVGLSRVERSSVTYDLGDGVTWTVPAAALTDAYKAQTWVLVRDVRGQLVRMPLSTALDLGARGGLFVAPEGVAVPLEDKPLAPPEIPSPPMSVPHDGDVEFNYPIRPITPYE